MQTPPKSFDQDVAFLKEHTDVIVLGGEAEGPRVAVVPAYQGRVMTSTTGGAGVSNGWIHYEHIAANKPQAHINPYGGEDRFWLGPEGGQYSVFFKAGDPFEFKHWQTPALIDTTPFEVSDRSADAVTFRHRDRLTNYSGFTFEMEIRRTIRLLSRADTERHLGGKLPDGVRAVAYESENTLTNRGEAAWERQSGLLSIWILGMLKHSADTTVVIPFEKGSAAERGPIVNDEYFGKVPADRLVVNEQAGVLYFKGDGQLRSKIGVGPRRAKGVCGSYAPSAQRLTVVQYTVVPDATDYVNSMWEQQKEPYAGDVINSYNDGPNESGKPLGPFYELETSSPALALKLGESATHVHRTVHLEGPPEALDPIAKRLLGVSLKEISAALPR